MTLIVDGNNVMGAAADGWWRDRAGAALRLFRRVAAYRAATGDEVVLALDVPHPDLPAGDNEGVAVVYPDRRGRDAADDRILEVLSARADASGVTVVTSDRALAADARALGAEVVGARTFLLSLSDLDV